MPAVISLSEAGAPLARAIAEALRGSTVFLHETVSSRHAGVRFQRIFDLVSELYEETDGMVFIGPCGVAVRALAPHLRSKLVDPPVVVVDVGGRYAISLLSGHEGGANDLAVIVGNVLGAEPVVTTTTEAAKTILVGIGCRRGCTAKAIVEAVRFALDKAGIDLNRVRYLASADVKAGEAGLIQAAQELGVPLRIIPSEEIRACTRDFSCSPLAQEKVNLPAVAEPAALLAGRRTTLIHPKTVHNHVAVAIAKEGCLSSESAREERPTGRIAQRRRSRKAISSSATSGTFG
ncbi:MAG: cobalamin biosynthesis protein [Syntrophaceae bacterium]